MSDPPVIIVVGVMDGVGVEAIQEKRGEMQGEKEKCKVKKAKQTLKQGLSNGG